ncbi:MAG: hypothetical protein IH598_09000 [Bacteroidales bacterium]|nr:hypothetical protein [Bacteroidales bacterium]
MEKDKVVKSLRQLFPSAHNIYVDERMKLCEVNIFVDDFRGIIHEKLLEKEVLFEMEDYWDNFPFKYVFSYRIR